MSQSVDLKILNIAAVVHMGRYLGIKNVRHRHLETLLIIFLILPLLLLIVHAEGSQGFPTTMSAVEELCHTPQFNETIVMYGPSQTYVAKMVTTSSGLAYRIENNLWGIKSYNGISYLAFNPLTGTVCYYGNFTNVVPSAAVWAYPEAVVDGYKPWDGYPVYNIYRSNLTLPSRVIDLLKPGGGGYSWIRVTYSVAYSPVTFPVDFAFDIWMLYNPHEVGAITKPDLELMIWLFFNNTNITWAEVGTTEIPIIVDGVYRNVTFAVLVSCNFPWTYVAVIPQDIGNTTEAGGWRSATVEFQLAPFLNTILQFVPLKECATGLSSIPVKNVTYLENLTMVDIELGMEFGDRLSSGAAGYVYNIDFLSRLPINEKVTTTTVTVTSTTETTSTSTVTSTITTSTVTSISTTTIIRQQAPMQLLIALVILVIIVVAALVLILARR